MKKQSFSHGKKILCLNGISYGSTMKKTPHTQKRRPTAGTPGAYWQEVSLSSPGQLWVSIWVPELFKHVDSVSQNHVKRPSASCHNSSSVSFPHQFMIFLASDLMTSLPIFCLVLLFRFYTQIYISRLYVSPYMSTMSTFSLNPYCLFHPRTVNWKLCLSSVSSFSKCLCCGLRSNNKMETSSIIKTTWHYRISDII